MTKLITHLIHGDEQITVPKAINLKKKKQF